jgi:hypothetical protein
MFHEAMLPEVSLISLACMSGNVKKHFVQVVSVGAENNTFGTPGVEAHAHFLKEIADAR